MCAMRVARCGSVLPCLAFLSLSFCFSLPQAAAAPTLVMDTKIIDSDFPPASLDLQIGIEGNGTGQRTNERRSLLKFSVSEVETEAKLRLYVYQGWDSGSITASVHRVTEAWNTGATWGSSDGFNAWTDGGAFVSTAEDVVTFSGLFRSVEWDVTDLVNGWVNGTFPNHGLLVKVQSPTGYTRRNLHSMETTGITSRKPAIVIPSGVDVPEPSSMALLTAGAAGLAIYGFRRHRRRK